MGINAALQVCGRWSTQMQMLYQSIFILLLIRQVKNLSVHLKLFHPRIPPMEVISLKIQKMVRFLDMQKELRLVATMSVFINME